MASDHRSVSAAVLKMLVLQAVDSLDTAKATARSLRDSARPGSSDREDFRHVLVKLGRAAEYMDDARDALGLD